MFGCPYRIVIPKSAVRIEEAAFKKAENFSEVFYTGTRSEWEAIVLLKPDGTYNEGANEYLLSATIYCYSEAQPTESGNFWHYDTDGVTPVKW